MQYQNVPARNKDKYKTKKYNYNLPLLLQLPPAPTSPPHPIKIRKEAKQMRVEENKKNETFDRSSMRDECKAVASFAIL